ncbi:uncharacterized protein LOC127260272 [Andrographis paniculata]|uniref:uncharacterized protein LOC127260272 n=1 Tax=Andrographis paniculata TaxID=175694 RepID=UPI0021E84BDB|nr:uncharacterized protein LOC127260272 [Andrographis paniculata]
MSICEMVSQYCSGNQENGKIRICIDFRDLNLATPKDEYVMPIADMLIDSAAGHRILSLMNGYAGCPGALGIYEWTVIPFGLKNAGATYQRAMNTIFHDLIGQSMEQYNLKMNPTKCAFGVSAGNFLGFLVHEKGIEIDANKAKAVLSMRSPQSVKEVQSLLGKEQQKALEEIKQALIKPPVLVPPRGDRPFRLYVANSFDVVSSLLVQEWEDVFACTRLEHYILPRETEVVSKMDLIKLILHRPTMQGRLMKWAIKLAPFALRHRPLKEVKGQVVADLLAEFASDQPLENKLVPYIGTSFWKMFFDGSLSKGKSGAGVILEGPGGSKISLQLQMEEMTHNSAEYEALILGLEALIAKGVQSIIICGDSQLVINQVLKRYACNYPHLHRYRDTVFHLLYKIAEVVFEHVPRTENRLADNLAQSACRQMIGNIDSRIDWRIEIMVYLESPSSVTPLGIRLKALRFQLIKGVLYKRTFEGVLLRCLGPEESIKVIEEVHGGICGAHRADLLSDARNARDMVH